MFYNRVFGLLSTLLVKFYLVQSFCEIFPGDRNLGGTATFDGNLVLNCSAKSKFHGLRFDSVNWTRNKKPVTEKDQVRQNSIKTWSAVFLTNVTIDQETFQCLVARGDDNDSCDATPSRPILKMIQYNKVVTEREWLDIAVCIAKRGWPNPSISWWRNGSRIRDGDNHYSYDVDHKSTGVLHLKIRYIQGYHQGTYTCRADNIFGTSTEDINVIVKRLSMIKWRSVFKNTILAVEGKSALLECFCSKDECKEAKARPYWKYNNDNVRNSSRVKFGHTITENNVRISLTIRNVSQMDGGKYICGISTSKGFDEKTRSVQVFIKDNFLRVMTPEKKVIAGPKSVALFQCRAIFPEVLPHPPKTFWMYNDTLIGKAGSLRYGLKEYNKMKFSNSTVVLRFDLTIFNVSLDDYGQYICGAEFINGEEKVKSVTSLTLVEEEEKKLNDNEQHKGPIGSGHEKTPLVAISSITAGGIIMGFVVAFFAYRICRSKRNTDEPFFEASVDGHHQFRYDVFVTFSNHDLNWVKKELIPLVEKHKLNYCIHDRDFEIGKPVVDNMAQSVYTSRKVLAVMSQNYLSSKFCRGELEMALYRSTEMGDSSVIVMRIDGVDRSKLPKALRNRTFLDYNDFTERKNWEERLIKHLKPPTLHKCSKASSEKSYTLLKNVEV